jgi:hypothetical protein
VSRAAAVKAGASALALAALAKHGYRQGPRSGRFAVHKRIRLVVAAALFGIPLLAACVADTGEAPPQEDAGYEAPDSGTPLPCANAAGIPCPDATAPADAGHDATVQDSALTEDAPGADTNQPDAFDAGSDAFDAEQPDAFDAEQPDAFDAGPDAFDAGPDAFDAGPDAFDAEPDAFDAAPDVDAGPPQCATAVVSNYYLRNDGTVIYLNFTSNEILIDSTSAPLTNVTQVFAETFGGCALRSDDTVWCWATSTSGNNTSGELGNGTFTDISTTAALYRANQVQIEPADGGPVTYLDQVTSLPTQSSVASGGSAEPGICAIRTDKTLWCWGPATEGNLWQGTIGSVANLAYATQMRLASDAGADAAAPIANVDQISSGGRHMCFVSAGNVYCWGDNTSGELGTGDTIGHPYPVQVTANLPSNVSFVGAGADQSCAVASGNVFCWGADTYNTEGDPYVDASVCNSNYCQPLPVPVQAALADGGLTHTPLAGVTALAIGDDFACAVGTGKAVQCWGTATGTPVLVAEAVPFVNPQAINGVPSGPVTSLSAQGDGFQTQLKYITTSGVYVNGTQVVTQVCP